MPMLYRKTDKGAAEIATRSHRLPPRLRQLLILVDGRRDDAELRRLVHPGCDEALHALAADGFIELVGITAVHVVAQPPAAAAPSVPSAPVPLAAAAPNLEQLRRDAVRALTDQLGPAAEALALKIERTRSADELRRLLEMGQHSLRQLRGAAAAAAFAERFGLRATQ